MAPSDSDHNGPIFLTTSELNGDIPFFVLFGFPVLGRFEYVSVTDDMIDDCIELFLRSFCLDEPISICTEIASSQKAQEELIELSKITLQDGASVAAIDKVTGKIVSVAFNKIQVGINGYIWYYSDSNQSELAIIYLFVFQKRLCPGETAFFDDFADNCVEPSSKEFVKFMYFIDSKCDIFDQYQIDYSLELMFLFTDRAYRGMKIGRSICLTTGKLGVMQAIGKFKLPKYPNIKLGGMSAVCSNALSLRIARRSGLDELVSLGYEQFMHNGKSFVDFLPKEQTGVVLVGKKFEQYQRVLIKRVLRICGKKSLMEELIFSIPVRGSKKIKI